MNETEKRYEKTAVVTGASKGIGYEICKVMLRDGYKVYGLARSEGSLTDVCWKPCDVTDSASVLRVFEEILKERGGIDVLVCNAGIGISGAAEFAPEHDYQMQTDVNFNGAVRCAQAAVPAMRRAGRGKIVFISSLAAVFPLPVSGILFGHQSGSQRFQRFSGNRT